MYHTATALSLGPGRTQVTMFGGSPKWEHGKSLDAQQKLAKTTVLDFGEQNTHDSIRSLAVSGLFISLINYLPALLTTLERLSECSVVPVQLSTSLQMCTYVVSSQDTKCFVHALSPC